MYDCVEEYKLLTFTGYEKRKKKKNKQTPWNETKDWNHYFAMTTSRYTFIVKTVVAPFFRGWTQDLVEVAFPPSTVAVEYCFYLARLYIWDI